MPAPVPVPPVPAVTVSVCTMSRPSAALSCSAPVEVRLAVTPVCDEVQVDLVATFDPVSA